MGFHLKVTFLLIGLLKFSVCESVLGNIDSITIEIDLDSESTNKSEFPNKISKSNIHETAVYFDNEAQKTTNFDDLKTLFTNNMDSEHDLENSTVNEGDITFFEKLNNSVSSVEDFIKKEEQGGGINDDAGIKFENIMQKSASYFRRHNKTNLHPKVPKRFGKKEITAEHNSENEIIHTSEKNYQRDTKLTQEGPYNTNDHESKVLVSDDYEPLETKVHNLLHRYKTTAVTILDKTELNEDERKLIKSYIQKHETLTTKTVAYDHYPTKTTTLTSKDSSDLNKDSTDFSTESSFFLSSSVTNQNTNSKNEITMVDSHHKQIDKELPTSATKKNLYYESTISNDVEKETIREWMPLNFDKNAPEQMVTLTHIEKDELSETKTVAPRTWIPEYETASKGTTQASNYNYTTEHKTSSDLETISTIDRSWSKDNDVVLKPTNKTRRTPKTKCKFAKNVDEFDLNKLQGVLQTVYYTMPDKIPCFKIFMMKLSKEEQQQYHDIYGDFNGKINWSRCDLEIKAETKIRRKHFLQNSGFPDGVFENKIIVDESVDADLDEKPILFEDTPDQWTLVNNLILLRDCKTGWVMLFKRNPRSRVSRRELKEALFIAGEGFNGRLSCHHKGRDPSDF